MTKGRPGEPAIVTTSPRDLAAVSLKR